MVELAVIWDRTGVDNRTLVSRQSAVRVWGQFTEFKVDHKTEISGSFRGQTPSSREGTCWQRSDPLLVLLCTRQIIPKALWGAPLNFGKSYSDLISRQYCFTPFLTYVKPFCWQTAHFIRFYVELYSKNRLSSLGHLGPEGEYGCFNVMITCSLRFVLLPGITNAKTLSISINSETDLKTVREFRFISSWHARRIALFYFELHLTRFLEHMCWRLPRFQILLLFITAFDAIAITGAMSTAENQATAQNPTAEAADIPTTTSTTSSPAAGRMRKEFKTKCQSRPMKNLSTAAKR